MTMIPKRKKASAKRVTIKAFFAAATAEEMETIETIYEPFLIQIGMLERTPRGRKATILAYEHLKKKYLEN